MTQNFIRYSPDVEQMDPDFERTHQANKQERKEPQNLAEVFGEQMAAGR
jgi:hypothetical protein